MRFPLDKLWKIVTFSVRHKVDVQLRWQAHTSNLPIPHSKLTVGRSKRKKSEGLSAVAVFRHESKFHIKDEGTNYYSVFNAISNYGSDSFADFDDSQDPDKEKGDNDDDEEDNGTLIMAYG